MADVKRSNPDAYKKMAVQLAGLDSHQVRVGWFENDKEENGTPSAYAAAIQEFGYGKIPPRLGLRETIEKERNVWKEFAKSAAKQVLDGKWNGSEAAEAIGLRVMKDFYNRINSNPSPALSPITIALRYRRENNQPISGGIVGMIARKLKEGKKVPMSKNTQALVDTGRLLGNLNIKVEDA